MNRLVKASVAGAAGIALLMGGAGTFSLWNSAATIRSGTVSSGTLSIAAAGTGVWKDATDAQNVRTISDIGAFRIVPGNKLTFSQDLTLNATGDDLTATLSFANPTLTQATQGGDLSTYLTPVVTATADDGAHVVVDNTAKTATVTAVSGGTTTVHAVVTLVFSKDTSGVAGQAQSVQLGDSTFTLAQNAPTGS